MPKLAPASALALALLLAATPPAEAAPRRQALLVSLPGASGAELEALYRAGELTAGGFAPFFERGEVGPELEPVDPTLPGPTAIALVTGAPPGRSGAVGERWRPAGGALRDRVDLDASPLPASTLWTVARDAEMTVGAVLWPGLDNSNRERHVDWGISPREIAHFPPRSIKLTRARWVDNAYGRGPGPSLYWGLPPTVRSHSTPLAFSVPFMMPHERHELIYDLVAIDRTDDGVENYDGLLVTRDPDPKKGFVGIVEPGGWLRVELPFASGSRQGSPEVAWIKVIELDPRLERTWVHVTGTFYSRAYPSSLVRRLESDKVVYPGSLDEKSLEAGLAGGYGFDEATFVEQAERLAAFAVDATLAGLDLKPTDLALVELPLFDAAGRRLARVEEAEIGPRLAAARRELWRGVDRQLARLLAGLDLATTRVYLVSGYASGRVHSDVDVGDLLRLAPGLGGLRERAGGPGPWSIETAGGLAHVYLPVAGRDRDGVLAPAEARSAARAVADALAAARDGEAPLFSRVLLRREARRLGLDHANAGDVVAFAAPGYRLVTGTKNPVAVERDPEVDAVAGRSAAEPAARGLWLALGTGIEPRRLRRPPSTLDVARRVAAALDLPRPKN